MQVQKLHVFMWNVVSTNRFWTDEKVKDLITPWDVSRRFLAFLSCLYASEPVRLPWWPVGAKRAGSVVVFPQQSLAVQPTERWKFYSYNRKKNIHLGKRASLLDRPAVEETRRGQIDIETNFCKFICISIRKHKTFINYIFEMLKLRENYVIKGLTGVNLSMFVLLWRLGIIWKCISILFQKQKQNCW